VNQPEIIGGRGRETGKNDKNNQTTSLFQSNFKNCSAGIISTPFRIPGYLSSETTMLLLVESLPEMLL